MCAFLLQSETSAIYTATLCSYCEYIVYHSYEFDMDTEKQRQRRRDDTKLTESGDARSEQLLY